MILGLDIGGANLKAATADGRAVTVPFALWKEPDGLPAVLAGLVEQFPDAAGFAVTMTGELCDCYETKRQGVNAILDAAVGVARAHPVRVWGTDGRFRTAAEGRAEPLAVAAANWHALATWAGGYVPDGPALLVDVGSTTADVVPLLDGVPVPRGRTDFDRLAMDELVYTGVRRTPVCAVLGFGGAAELFATALDVYLLLGRLPENPADTDTADGRPATRAHAHARLSRMLGGDPETVPPDVTHGLAEGIAEQQRRRIGEAADRANAHLEHLTGRDRRPGFGLRVVTAGSGQFLAWDAVRGFPLGIDPSEHISLTDQLGPAVSACAPAYALAVLATERG